MRDYDMSTHDISTIFRSTVGVGMLVPFCKILCPKGDIIDLNLINKTLSQPTLGPLFGSFKLQHFMFFGGFRLYNSWLHNNRTGIGMKMSDIKLPMMYANTYGTATDAKTNISSSVEAPVGNPSKRSEIILPTAKWWRYFPKGISVITDKSTSFKKVLSTLLKTWKISRYYRFTCAVCGEAAFPERTVTIRI